MGRVARLCLALTSTKTFCTAMFGEQEWLKYRPNPFGSRWNSDRSPRRWYRHRLTRLSLTLCDGAALEHEIADWHCEHALALDEETSLPKEAEDRHSHDSVLDGEESCPSSSSSSSRFAPLCSSSESLLMFSKRSRSAWYSLPSSWPRSSACSLVKISSE